MHVIGDPIDPTHPMADLGQLATDLASALSRNVDSFLKLAHRLVGRFILVHQVGAGSPRLLSDVTGMYSMFDGRDGSRRFVGSHARLVAAQIGAAPQRSGISQRWGTCANATAFAGVHLHSPSQDLCIADGSRRRIFPGATAETISIEACAELMIERASGALRGLMARREVVVSLTAGGDTRGTLAIVLRIGANPEFFTYDTIDPAPTIDVAVARALARELGLKHRVVNRALNESVPEGLVQVLVDSTSMPHGRGLAFSYINSFGVDRVTHVRSNVLEFFRQSAVDKVCSRIGVTPDTPEAAASLYQACLKRKWSPDAEAAAIRRFRWQFEDGGWSEALEHMDARDLYFIEHRMANWHSNLILESDYAFDTFILFNSRELFGAAMQIPKDVRASGALIHQFYRMAGPEVLRLPINPARFP